MQVRDNRLYLDEVPAELLARRYGTPLYVYEEETIRRCCAELARNIPYGSLRIHYACKANSNPAILRLFKEMGINVETVSQGEVLLALQAGFTREQLLHTCSNMAEAELRFLVDNQIMVNLDSLGQLRRYGQLNPGAGVSIRINQGIGAGHHRHVITGGAESKFGIHASQVAEAQALCRQHSLRLCGIHQHIGSDVLDPQILLEAMDAQLRTAATLPDLEFVDLGGGFGVPCRHQEKPLDMRRLGPAMAARFTRFCREYGRKLTMVLEPGRYLVAEAGTLLTTVTDVKRAPGRTFVGVDSGLNHLIRPALYGAYHQVVNASRAEGEEEVVTIAGNICESGDLFARDRLLARFQECDILAILGVGAYGYSMSSNYNSRPRPAEVLVTGVHSRVIREQEPLAGDRPVCAEPHPGI